MDAFNTFIALMLSSQTKDQVVGEAVENLKASPGGLTVDSILAMSDEVGFPKQFPWGFFVKNATI